MEDDDLTILNLARRRTSAAMLPFRFFGTRLYAKRPAVARRELETTVAEHRGLTRTSLGGTDVYVPDVRKFDNELISLKRLAVDNRKQYFKSSNIESKASNFYTALTFDLGSNNFAVKMPRLTFEDGSIKKPTYYLFQDFDNLAVKLIQKALAPALPVPEGGGSNARVRANAGVIVSNNIATELKKILGPGGNEIIKAGTGPFYKLLQLTGVTVKSYNSGVLYHIELPEIANINSTIKDINRKGKHMPIDVKGQIEIFRKIDTVGGPSAITRQIFSATGPKRMADVLSANIRPGVVRPHDERYNEELLEFKERIAADFKILPMKASAKIDEYIASEIGPTPIEDEKQKIWLAQNQMEIDELNRQEEHIQRQMEFYSRQAPPSIGLSLRMKPYAEMLEAARKKRKAAEAIEKVLKKRLGAQKEGRSSAVYKKVNYTKAEIDDIMGRLRIPGGNMGNVDDDKKFNDDMLGQARAMLNLGWPEDKVNKVLAEYAERLRNYMKIINDLHFDISRNNNKIEAIQRDINEQQLMLDSANAKLDRWRRGAPPGEEFNKMQKGKEFNKALQARDNAKNHINSMKERIQEIRMDNIRLEMEKGQIRQPAALA